VQRPAGSAGRERRAAAYRQPQRRRTQREGEEGDADAAALMAVARIMLLLNRER
jgi:hypothetical protein